MTTEVGKNIGLSRRQALVGSVAIASALSPCVRAATLTTPPPLPAPLPVPLPASGAVPSVNPALARMIAVAKQELDRNSKTVWLRDKVGVVDFSMPSRFPRFFLIDLLSGTSRPYFVTHGKGSDPEHDGWLKTFSNVDGSAATSRGAYTTGNYYEGVHGLSMRLTGLEADNSHAVDRAIVIHAAAYADPSLITTQGKLGRSEGCFVFPQTNLIEIIARMGPGRLLFADKLTAMTPPLQPPVTIQPVTAGSPAGVGSATGTGARDGSLSSTRGLANDAKTGASRP